MTAEFVTEFLAQSDPRDTDLYNQVCAFEEQADATSEIPPAFFEGLDLKYLNDPEDVLKGKRPSILKRCERIEALAYASPSMMVAHPGPSLSFTVIDDLATPEQKARFLNCFDVERPVWGAFALTEPQSGSDATRLSTTATEVDGGYVLNGAKRYIGNCGRAAYVVVFATVAPAKGQFGIRAFYVPLPAAGAHIHDEPNITGMRVVRPTQIGFSDCFVSKENLIGAGGPMELSRSFALAQKSFDAMRPGLSSLMIGASYGCIDRVLDAADEMDAGVVARVKLLAETFEGPLASARGLARKAAKAFDDDLGNSAMASICKANAQRVACSVIDGLRRISGLHNTKQQAVVDRFWRDFQAFRVMEGTADVQDLMIARARLAQHDHQAPQRVAAS